MTGDSNQGQAAPAPATGAALKPARAPVDVDEHYSGIRTLHWLGLKLVFWMVLGVALLTLAAALRQKYIEWPPSPFMAAIPKKDLPPYHQIQLSDFEWKVRLVDNIESKLLASTDDVVGRYTLETLPKGKPIAESQLGPTVTGTQFLSKVVVEVPSPKSTVEKLKAGDLIDVAFKSAPTQGQQSGATPNPIFQNILVLNVKRIGESDDYLLILALPLERHTGFVAEIEKETSFTLQRKELTN